MFESFCINFLHEPFADIYYNCSRPLMCTRVWSSGNNAHEIYVNELNKIMTDVGLGSSVAYSEIYVSFCVLILI
jgi:hypothetical protein